jgi:formylglycine-generating enzyme required for sulfatase activity
MREPILALSTSQARALAGRTWVINGQTYQFQRFDPNAPGQPPWRTGMEGQAFPLVDASGRVAIWAKFFKTTNRKRFRRATWLIKRRIFAHGQSLTAAPMLWADSRSIGRPVGVGFDITACCALAVPGETWRELKCRVHDRSVVFPKTLRWRCVEDLLAATATLEQLGIVHGDLSDNNITIDLNAPADHPALYLIDFDAYVATRAPGLTLTGEEGGTCGTHGYCPPDLAARFTAGDRSATPFSDRHARDTLILELLLYSERYGPEDTPTAWPRDAHLAKLCSAAKACCPRPELQVLMTHLQAPNILDLPETSRPRSCDLLRPVGAATASPLVWARARIARFLGPHPAQSLLAAAKAQAAVWRRRTIPATRFIGKLTTNRHRWTAVSTAMILALLLVCSGRHHPPARLLPFRESPSSPVTHKPEPSNTATLLTGRNLPTTIPELPMVYIEPGIFQMGSATGESDETPVHTVRISSAFWMGRYKVTQSQYESLMRANPSDTKGQDLPVNNVSWNNAVVFCQRLTELHHRAGRLSPGYAYRLPTEAEWEYAARGGVKSRGFEYPGSHDPNEVAWYEDNDHRELHPVGQKTPNELGLYDMSGDVGEWCRDWYDPSYYDLSPASDPPGASLSRVRVVRGGHRHCSPAFCRSTNRGWAPPVAPIPTMGYGFRVVAAWDPTLENQPQAPVLALDPYETSAAALTSDGLPAL